MAKKFLIIFILIIILLNLYCSSVHAETVVQAWNNMATTYGSLINYSNLPTTIGENDRYMFYYYHSWAGNHVAYNIGFCVVRNVSSGFYATYEPRKGNGDGIIQFYNINGWTNYRYDTSSNTYTQLATSSNGTELTVAHTAILGYYAEMIYDDTIPSVFLSNFDLRDYQDTSVIVHHKNINNSWLYFTDTETFALGGNSNSNFVLNNNYDYNPDYEPILYVYIGNNVSDDTLHNTVYLNSFRLNSGNYSIPYNRIFKNELSVGTRVWFLLSIPDENNNRNRSFFNATLTGSITVTDYEPTTPDTGGGGGGSSDNDYSEIINSQQQTTNAIQEQTIAIQEQTQVQQDFNDDFFSTDVEEPDSIGVDNNVNDNTADLTNIFNLFSGAFHEFGEDKSFEFQLPNGDVFTFTLPSQDVHDFIEQHTVLKAFLHSIWWVLLGGFVVFDFKKMYNKFKTGDLETVVTNNSPIDNVVKELLR